VCTLLENCLFGKNETWDVTNMRARATSARARRARNNPPAFACGVLTHRVAHRVFTVGKPRSTYMHCGSTSQHLYAAANKLRSTFYILREYHAVPTCTYSSTSQHLYATANKFRSTFYILRHSLAAYASRREHLAQRLCIAVRPARTTSSYRRVIPQHYAFACYGLTSRQF
jgi:hypothetical protein